MSQMRVIEAGQCLHVKWCQAKQGQPHADTCPTNVLKLSDVDVDRFCALFVEKHKTTKGARDYIIGRYKGLMAKCTLGSGLEAERASARWLVENLLMVARERKL